MDKLKPPPPNPQPSASANPLLPAPAEGRPREPQSTATADHQPISSTDRLSSATAGSHPVQGRNVRHVVQDTAVFASSPRVLVFSSSTERKLSSLSPFQRKEGCDRFGKVTRCDKLRDGAIEVEFATACDAARALRATAFAYSVRDGDHRRDVLIPMTVAPHRTKNSVKGIINCFDLRDVSEDEIVEGLSGFGVTQAKRITTRRGGAQAPTDNIILTFQGNDLPPNVLVGYVRVKVRAFIPSPMRCFSCQKYGHPRTRCNGRPTCSRCASTDHTDENCDSDTLRCVNCGGGHSSYDRSCPAYKREQEINSIKATRNISFREAREVYNETHPKTSYAQVVRGSSIPTAKTSLEQMSAAQLVLLLKSFGLAVVSAGAATEGTVPPAPSDAAAPAAQSALSVQIAPAPAPVLPPPTQAASPPVRPRRPTADGEVLRRQEEERRAREAKRARLIEKAREAKRSPGADSTPAGSSRGASTTPEAPQAMDPPALGPPPPPPLPPPPPPPQRRPPLPLPAATPLARPPPAASEVLTQSPSAPGRPTKRKPSRKGSPSEGENPRTRLKFQSGTGNTRSISADGRPHQEGSHHPRIHFGEGASSDAEFV